MAKSFFFWSEGVLCCVLTMFLLLACAGLIALVLEDKVFPKRRKEGG